MALTCLIGLVVGTVLGRWFLVPPALDPFNGNLFWIYSCWSFLSAAILLRERRRHPQGSSVEAILALAAIVCIVGIYLGSRHPLSPASRIELRNLIDRHLSEESDSVEHCRQLWFDGLDSVLQCQENETSPRARTFILPPRIFKTSIQKTKNLLSHCLERIPEKSVRLKTSWGDTVEYPRKDPASKLRRVLSMTNDLERIADQDSCLRATDTSRGCEESRNTYRNGMLYLMGEWPGSPTRGPNSFRTWTCESKSLHSR